VEELMKLRKLPNHESLIVKFGVDEGQSFTKIMLSLIHVLGHIHNQQNQSQPQYEDTGLKRLHMVAVTPVKETYDNLATLFKLLDIPSFNFLYQFCPDLKAMATMTGLSSAGTATCPCPICLWKRKDGASGEVAPTRTIQMNIDDYNNWIQQTGGRLGRTESFITSPSIPSQSMPTQNPALLTSWLFLLFMNIQEYLITCFVAWRNIFRVLLHGPSSFVLRGKNIMGKFFR
jgi:hypothetical protein